MPTWVSKPICATAYWRGIDAIEAATGERDVTTIGYCVGGTLLAVTLAYMAAKGDRRSPAPPSSRRRPIFGMPATSRFSPTGADRSHRSRDERDRLSPGRQDGQRLQHAAAQRADLVLRGRQLHQGKGAAAFRSADVELRFDPDAAANHAFYLRNCYLGNKLTQGEMTIGGETLDLKRVVIPVYNLATREDHIAPARSCSREPSSSAAPCATSSPVRATSRGSSTRRARPNINIGPALRSRAASRIGWRSRSRPQGAGGRTGSMDHAAGPRQGSGASTGGRQAGTALRRAGRICQGKKLTI